MTKPAAMTNNFRPLKFVPAFCSKFFIFYLLFFIFAAPVSAEEAPRQSALGVSPAVLEEVLGPGEEKKLKIRVFNVTNFPLPIKGSVKNFTPNEEISEEAKRIFDASTWFKIDPADFILQPQENKEITVTILPPKEAEPGGHYATIYFQPLLPVEVLSPQTAYVAARVGVLAFLIVKGEITEKASLTDLTVPALQQFGPVNFKLGVKNEGNVHLLPAGQVTVWDWRGREVAKLPLTPSQVLPQTTKEFKFVWPKKYLLGRFRAQAQISYGAPQASASSSLREFWVVPWVPLSLVVFLLTGFGTFFILVRKRLRLALTVLLHGSVSELERGKTRAVAPPKSRGSGSARSPRFKKEGRILKRFFLRKGVNDR